MNPVSVSREYLEAVREALVWFIENDETNRGDEPMPHHGGQSWDQINAYWIAGLDRGTDAVAQTEQYLASSPTE